MPRLQSGAVVRIAGPIIAEPNDTNVTVGVGGDPGEEVGAAPVYLEAHIDWVRPRRPLIGRERVEHVGVVRPDRVDEPEVIRGKGWEKIQRTLILRTRRAGEDLSIGEGEGGQAQLRVGGYADVDAPKGSTRKVFRYAVRSHKDLVKVAAARAAAAVHLDLPGDVSAIARRYAAHSGECLGVNSLAESSEVRVAAVARELHVNVKRGHVMVVQVHVLGAEPVDPLAVVARDDCDNWVWGTKGVTAIRRVRARHAGSQRKACKREVGYTAWRVVHGNIHVTAPLSDANQVAARSENSASEESIRGIVRLTFILERIGVITVVQGAVNRPVEPMEIYAAGHPADTAHIDCAVRRHPNARLKSSHDESNRELACEGRQGQFLVRAEVADGQDGAVAN